MKTLRKGDKFKRVKDTTTDDREVIKTFLSAGWSFCDKSTWRREGRDKGKTNA